MKENITLLTFIGSYEDTVKYTVNTNIINIIKDTKDSRNKFMPVQLITLSKFLYSLPLRCNFFSRL